MTTILSFIMWVAGLFGFGQKDERDVSHDQGMAQGKAETERNAAVGELHDIQKADDARTAVRDDDVVGMLNDHANQGPAKSQ